MDTAEEPQKKIFKARKTMKASDRQQLEALHKAKEDRLKPTELKLVNGIHENGISNINYTHKAKEPMENTKNLNGVLDLKHDSHKMPVVKLSDLREGLKHVNQSGDLKLTLDLLLDKSTVCKEVDKTRLTEDAIQTCSTKEDQDEKVPQEREELEASDLLLEEFACEPEFSEEQAQSDIPNEVESCSVLEEKSSLEVESPMEESNVQKLENEDMDGIPENPIDKEENEVKESDDIKEPLDATSVDSIDVVEKEDMIPEEQEDKGSSEELPSEIQNIEETENHTEEQESAELINGSLDTNDSPDVNMEEEKRSPSQDKMESLENEVSQNDTGDEAISSSMEVDQNVKTPEPKSPLAVEAPFDKPVSDIQTGSALENADEMETEEIIPILEKLAPVEDLQCFSEGKEDSETVPDDEEKAESIAPSPVKNDTSETLPSEGFLVLSDEEEPSMAETTPLKESMANDQDNVKVEEPEEKPDEELKEPENKEEPQAEKSEVSRRKRSKSEDLDSQSLKRRRFEGEEYEAELKVKITAGDDVNEKLQKVIQKMFEEKLSALQCLDFDKAIAELKSRVEKIESKKHETALSTMQAKISRLTRRFGAAKEDLKKRPEAVAAKQPASMAKTAVNDPTPNAVNLRNSGTVRQMLETKRGGTDTGTANVQSSPAAPSSAPSSSNLTFRAPNTPQTSVNQSPASNTLQTRPAPDWKLIQQKINASSIGASQNTMSSQSKSMPPVTSAPVMTSVFTSPTTATVVGSNQVSTSNTQPMSVSLQSLPVILHVPVAVNSQSQILQGATGTLVTNQQSGNVEFIQVQNQSTVNNLTKTPVSLAVSKAMTSSSMVSAGIQRNPSVTTMNSPMTVQAMPTSHSVTLSSRQSLPNVSTSGVYNQGNNRNAPQLKSPVSAFNSSTTTSEPSSGNRSDLQINRTSMADNTPNKRNVSDSSAMGGKPAAGVIDLTLDEEEAEMSTHDTRRNNSSSIPTSIQASQSMGRQIQPLQANTVQTSSAPSGLPSQTTIHVLPAAQTTVNITQRPGIQTTPRAPVPRAPTNQHMVYTTTTLPNVSAQTPIRNTVMQNQNLRQITPQTGGVNVRMPQTPTYVVNNGMSIGSTVPQLTVHHRPPQEPARPIHPAPLPEAPQPQRLPPEAASTSPPQKPHLKLARVQSQNGIVLSWSVLEVDRSCASVDSYHLYAYHEDPTATSSSQWKKIGEVKALPLPMACTLTQFVSGSKYYFAVRAKDIYGRFGPFCDPQSTDVIATQSS